MSYINSSTPSGYDSSKPTPLLSYLKDDEIIGYLEGSYV